MPKALGLQTKENVLGDVILHKNATMQGLDGSFRYRCKTGALRIYVEQKTAVNTAICLLRRDLDNPEWDNIVFLAGWWRKVCQNNEERWQTVYVLLFMLVFSSAAKNMDYHAEMN